MAKEPMKEEKYEDKLIARLASHGCYVKHIDCTTPGFPDLVVVPPGGKILLFEMKDGARGTKTAGLFEPSQFVFFSEMQRLRNDNAFAVLVTDKIVQVYPPNCIMGPDGMPLRELNHTPFVFNSIEAFTSWILDRGRK